MTKYKLKNNPIGTSCGVIVNDETHPILSEGAFIPADLDNRHYAEYLAWVDEGNTPDPAD